MENNDTRIKKLIKGNFFQVLAIAVACFNIWLAYKLTPVTTSLQLMNQRVEALEKIEPVGSKEWDYLANWLIRVEGKIDTVLLTK